MIITIDNRSIETQASLNDLIVIGEDFDIIGHRVYQLDWWSLSKQDVDTILTNFIDNNNSDCEHQSWYDMKLLRDLYTGLFKIIVSNQVLDGIQIEMILENQSLTIGEILSF